MPRDGTKNLIPFNKLTEEEQKELARRGGVKSGESRRQKRMLKDILEEYLKIDGPNGKPYEDEVTLALIKKASTGDADAYRTIRDTLGQKPVEQLKAEIETPVFKNDLDE